MLFLWRRINPLQIHPYNIPQIDTQSVLKDILYSNIFSHSEWELLVFLQEMFVESSFPFTIALQS